MLYLGNLSIFTTTMTHRELNIPYLEYMGHFNGTHLSTTGCDALVLTDPTPFVAIQGPGEDEVAMDDDAESEAPKGSTADRQPTNQTQDKC